MGEEFLERNVERAALAHIQADRHIRKLAHDLERLPEPLRRLQPDAAYPVKVADALVDLAKAVDSRLARQEPS